MNLSPNFTLEELTWSDTAQRLRLDNRRLCIADTREGFLANMIPPGPPR